MQKLQNYNQTLNHFTESKDLDLSNSIRFIAIDMSNLKKSSRKSFNKLYKSTKMLRSAKLFRRSIKKSKRKIQMPKFKLKAPYFNRFVRNSKQRCLIENAIQTGNLYPLESLFKDIIFDHRMKIGKNHQVDLRNLKKGFSIFKNLHIQNDLKIHKFTNHSSPKKPRTFATFPKRKSILSSVIAINSDKKPDLRSKDVRIVTPIFDLSDSPEKPKESQACPDLQTQNTKPKESETVSTQLNSPQTRFKICLNKNDLMLENLNSMELKTNMLPISSRKYFSYKNENIEAIETQKLHFLDEMNELD